MPLTAERKEGDFDRQLKRLTLEIERLKQEILNVDDPFDTQKHPELRGLHNRLDNLMSEHYRLQLARRKAEGQK